MTISVEMIESFVHFSIVKLCSDAVICRYMKYSNVEHQTISVVEFHLIRNGMGLS